MSTAKRRAVTTLRWFGAAFFIVLAVLLAWAAWETLQLGQHDRAMGATFIGLFWLTGALLLLRRRKAAAETQRPQRPWETWKGL